MQTIFELKEQAVTDTPLLVFDCTLANGRTERWSTHRGDGRRERHTKRACCSTTSSRFRRPRTRASTGSRESRLLLANADSHFSEIERAAGWKGARLTVALPVLRSARRRARLTDAIGDFPGDLQSAGRNHGGDVPADRNEPDEPAAAAAAAGAHPAAVSVGLSGDGGAASGSGGRRSRAASTRATSAADTRRSGGRHGQPERRSAVYVLRLHAGGLRGARHVRRISAASSSCRRRSRCAVTARRARTRRPCR